MDDIGPWSNAIRHAAAYKPCLTLETAFGPTAEPAEHFAETTCPNVAFWGILGHESQRTSRPTFVNRHANMSKSPRGNNRAPHPYIHARCAAGAFSRNIFRREMLCCIAGHDNFACEDAFSLLARCAAQVNLRLGIILEIHGKIPPFA
jgi:hypothetical protein